jgi:hypothetical protein
MLIASRLQGLVTLCAFLGGCKANIFQITNLFQISNTNINKYHKIKTNNEI